MKRKDALRIYMALQFILNEYKGFNNVRIVYLLALNKRMVEAEAQALISAGAESKEFGEYMRDERQAREQYADKDEKGKFILTNGNYTFNVNASAFYNAVLELRVKYADALKKRLGQIEELRELEDEEIEIPKFNMIDVGVMPGELGFMVDRIFEMLKYPETELVNDES